MYRRPHLGALTPLTATAACDFAAAAAVVGRASAPQARRRWPGRAGGIPMTPHSLRPDALHPLLTLLVGHLTAAAMTVGRAGVPQALAGGRGRLEAIR
ncbi:hypothetical protein GCM10027569_89840 [Flindersiella endophytica]